MRGTHQPNSLRNISLWNVVNGKNAKPDAMHVYSKVRSIVINWVWSLVSVNIICVDIIG